jgi:hypothetical protein
VKKLGRPILSKADKLKNKHQKALNALNVDLAPAKKKARNQNGEWHSGPQRTFTGATLNDRPRKRTGTSSGTRPCP